jgi:hypothetical protein
MSACYCGASYNPKIINYKYFLSVSHPGKENCERKRWKFVLALEVSNLTYFGHKGKTLTV